MTDSLKSEYAVRQAEQAYEEIDSNLREFADWFHDHEGELFPRHDVIDDLAEEFDVDRDHAQTVLSHLVGDRVDPVVQVDDGDTLWVGVIDYDEGDIYYEYTDYHPAYGEQTKLVCAQCVHDSEYDYQVAFAAPGEGSFGPDADRDALEARIREHFLESHPDVDETQVETGASLVAPSTVGGSEMIHKGNMSSEADAATVGGNAASDLAPTYNDGSVTCYNVAIERFGAEGSSTTSTGAVTIAGSDLTFNPDEYKDSAGNLYIRMKSHMKHNGAGTTYMRMYRQNAATVVSGTTVSVSGDGWGVADTGWVDFSAESGYESYQLQIWTSDGATGAYNSVLLHFGVPL